jgi:hypothetical protein
LSPFHFHFSTSLPFSLHFNSQCLPPFFLPFHLQ